MRQLQNEEAEEKTVHRYRFGQEGVERGAGNKTTAYGAWPGELNKLYEKGVPR